MEKRLVFEDKSGDVVRAFSWNGETAQVIRRGDTKRLELVKETTGLEKKKIPFENLGEVSAQALSNKPFLVGQLGHLKLVENVESTHKNLAHEQEKDQVTKKALLAVAVIFLLIMVLVALRPTVTPKMEEDLKQQVVKIVKQMQVKPKTADIATHRLTETVTPQNKQVALKRMGALAALGSLSKSTQRGGINLGAAKTSAGPGLGGTQGSGGVQTSLYGKGIVAAPVGVGGNIQGAGGYGTHGKGGGKEGYGKLSLIGSAGTSAIPLGQEATVASGLDRDQIAEVIQRNSGQVRFCYEQALQSDPSLNGRIAVDFTIGGNGLVKAAGIENTTMNSKSVEDCIVLRLRSWKFPLPKGGVDVKVSYPFVLRRTGQG